jgi:carboxylate-amine ligase
MSNGGRPLTTLPPLGARPDHNVSMTPEWSHWHPSGAYTVGIEEEVMLLDPSDWSLAHEMDELMPRFSEELGGHVTAETHGAAVELATGPHESVDGAADEAAALRAMLAAELVPLGLRAASAGTHPFTLWTDTQISSGARQQLVYGSMRELARREPTFALHVHVGIPDADAAIGVFNRLRSHLPLLLALSANSPFWQGRDTGLASARTPLFQAFPRVGIPRAFHTYDEYVETVDLMMRCGAFPEPTFLWWDVRLQPRFGTLEFRIMDAQATAARTRGLVALVQSIVHLELEQGYNSELLVQSPELLAENRFLAARDGIEARLIDPVAERRVPARMLLASLLDAVRPHAQALGCEAALQSVDAIARETGAAWQRRAAGGPDRLLGLVERLADQYAVGC